MIEKFLQSFRRVLDLTFLGVLFFLVVILAAREIADSFTLFHIKAGEYILQHGIPVTDVFTCSMIGHRWIDQGWIFQVICRVFYGIAGFNGVVVMKVLWAVAIFALLLRFGWQSRRLWLTMCLLLSVLLVDAPRAMSRTDTVSLFLFLFYLEILWKFLARRWSIYVLAALQVIWVNSHGLFILGPLIILVSIWSENLRRTVQLPHGWNYSGRLRNAEEKNLRYALLFTSGACFINPQFFYIFVDPLQGLFSAAKDFAGFSAYLQELLQPIGIDFAFQKNADRNYLVLLIVSFGSFLLNHRKMDIRVFLIWAGFLIFSLVSKTNATFFAFAAYWATLKNAAITFEPDATGAIALKLPAVFSKINPEWRRALRWSFIIALQMILIRWMLGFGAGFLTRTYYDAATRTQKSVLGGASNAGLPKKAADFIVANHLAGNFFNTHTAGLYLIFRAYPEVKVFIDHRIELFGPGFFSDYRRIRLSGDVRLFQKALNRYQITGVFFAIQDSNIPVDIARYLNARQGWRLVYFNDDGVIFLKNIAQNQRIIQKFTIDLNEWNPPPVAMAGHNAQEAAEYFNRGKILRKLGFIQPAIKEYEAAIQLAPNAWFYKELGKSYEQVEEYPQALDFYLKSKQADRWNYEISELLTRLYEKLDDYPAAAREAQELVNKDARNLVGYELLVRMLIKNKQYAPAFGVLQQADARNFSVEKMIAAGNLFLGAKELVWAQKVYELALKRGQNTSEIYYCFGLVAKAQGNPAKAEEWFQKAIDQDPDNQALIAKIERARVVAENIP